MTDTTETPETSVCRFLTASDHRTMLEALAKSKCRGCDGSGERNNAESGDISFNTWVCELCGGMGWDKTSVTELVEAADFFTTTPSNLDNTQTIAGAARGLLNKMQRADWEVAGKAMFDQADSEGALAPCISVQKRRFSAALNALAEQEQD